MPVPCTLIRGGTSRGAYFLQADLPQEPDARDAVLRRVMGGPDALQVDGIGGGHPLTSKVAVISPSADVAADVDYLFLQIDPQTQTVSDAQNCGNLLAGVGVFALDTGLVEARDSRTVVRVRMLNSNSRCDLELPTPGGVLQADGEAAIDGVPGTAAPIVCNYLDIAGSTCGSLLPTGRKVDEVDGVQMTCVDNGMPVVVLRAEDVGRTGRESVASLDADDELKAKLEAIRRQIGPQMNLGRVADKSVPKMCLVSEPEGNGFVMTRTFIPRVCHKSIGVLGAVSAATACLLEGTPGADVARIPPGDEINVAVQHPSGALELRLGLDGDGAVEKAGVVRTARLLFKGEVYT